MFGLFSFSTGFYSSYYFRKALDDKTGELLEYATVVNGDTLAHITGNFPYHDYYNYTGGEVEHLELQVYRERGSFLIRNILDSNGNITSNSDTVVRSFYSEIYDQNEENYESWRGKISKVNENSYYFVHEFIPNDTTSLPTAAELVHYDSDFNIVSSVDLTQFVDSFFHEIWRVSEEDFQLMVGILDRDNRPTNTVISPNPANNFIRLDLDIAKAQKIMIYNNLGNTVQMQIRVEANNINISQLPVGLYHINVHMMDGKYYSGSFVKQ